MALKAAFIRTKKGVHVIFVWKLFNLWTIYRGIFSFFQSEAPVFFKLLPPIKHKIILDFRSQILRKTNFVQH